MADTTTVNDLSEKTSISDSDLLLITDSDGVGTKAQVSNLKANFVGGSVAAGNTLAPSGDTVNSALTEYEKITDLQTNYHKMSIDTSSALSDIKTATRPSVYGGIVSYYVSKDTSNLPSSWSAVSTRGILEIRNINGVWIYELTLWGYTDTSTYGSKSGSFMCSCYYNGSAYVWEDWRIVSV